MRLGPWSIGEVRQAHHLTGMRTTDEVEELQRRERELGVDVDEATAAYQRATAASGHRHSLATEVTLQAFLWYQDQGLRTCSMRPQCPGTATALRQSCCPEPCG